MLQGTVFHPRTAPLCQAQNWRRWSGYIVAGSYELSPEREYWAIRSAAALLDVSPLYKYLIAGPDASRLVNRIVTRDVDRCAINQVMYTPWCDEAGKVIDDGTISRLGPQTFRVTSADPNYGWFCENAFGLRVTIQDVSAAVAALALQGPRSREILNRLSDAPLGGLGYYRLTRARLDGMGVTISRTGYTGDLGYEIWVEARDALALWDLLMDAGQGYGLLPAGMLALDIARIEAGLLLIETDYTSTRKALIESQKSSPFELGLGWTVHLDKENFVGRPALAAEQRRRPRWRFVGLQVDWDSLEKIYARQGLAVQLPAAAWRTSAPVYAGRRQVGYASSGCWSPLLKKYIALAHVRAPFASEGTPLRMEVTAEHMRKKARARTVRLPFFNPERKRQLA
jgi:glycine cleavage system T protein (aminomethyltransferase)